MIALFYLGWMLALLFFVNWRWQKHEKDEWVRTFDKVTGIEGFSQLTHEQIDDVLELRRERAA